MLAWRATTGPVKFGAPKLHSRVTLGLVMTDAGAVKLATKVPELSVETEAKTDPPAHLISTVVFAKGDPEDRNARPSTTANPSRAGAVEPQALATNSNAIINAFRNSNLRDEGTLAQSG
jgi:hypothetical protein